MSTITDPFSDLVLDEEERLLEAALASGDLRKLLILKVQRKCFRLLLSAIAN